MTPEQDYRELLLRAIQFKRRPPTRNGPRAPLWALVGQMLGLGSTSASRLCSDLGFDPSETVKVPRQ